MRELLRAGRRRVHHLYLAEGAGAGGAAAAAEIADLARRAGVQVRLVPRQEIDFMAATDSPQGAVARADPVAEVDLLELAQPAGTGPVLVVVLDGVTDPHNLGAVMRSALSAGATGLVVPRHRSAALSPAAVKAAAGAVEYLPIARVGGIPAALAALSKAGLWTVGLEATASAPVWDLAVASEPLALVAGAEGKGLSRLARQRCDVVVGIPQVGPLGSLNVSVATAVACFEVARLRRDN